MRVDDHNGAKEKEFFEKVKDNNKTQLYVMKNSTVVPNNIPTVPPSQAANYIIKKYK